jgi:hypothetical protein
VGGSAKTQQNSTSTYTPTQQAAAAYKDVLARGNAAVSDYDPATAKQVAGFSDPQMQAFQNIAGMQGLWAPHLDSATGMTESAGRGIGAGDIANFYNPFQNDVIAATMADINKQDAMAQRGYTANQTAQGGLGGSGFGIGRAQLIGDQSRNRNTALANLRNTGWQQALAAAQADKTRGLQAGQQLAGIGQLGSQLGYNDAAQLLASGNQQQAQAQAQYDAASQNATNKQLFPMQTAQWLSSIASGIGPLMGGTTKSSGTSTQSQGKGIGNAIGGAMTLASMASDERVKENIRVIGRTHDGQRIYKFNYTGDPRTQVGLLAQEVEQTHPEAVSERPDGVKMVNYDAALADADEGYADGGLALPAGLMGWADLRPGRPIVPEAMQIAARPGEQQDGFDPKAAMQLGKDAAGGIGNLMALLSPSTLPAASSPAGGALAASGLQGLDSGMLSGIGSLLGFAEGGGVPSFASRVHTAAHGGQPNAALISYLAPSRAALTASMQPRAPAPQPAPQAPVSSGKGRGFFDQLGSAVGKYGDVLGDAFGYPGMGEAMRGAFPSVGFANGGGISPLAGIGGGLGSIQRPAGRSGFGDLGRRGLMGPSPFADGGLVPTPEELFAIEMQESGGREDVVSPKGARGPMQVMPSTARDPGFGVTPLRDDSAAENRRFGRDYYAALLKRYDGDRDAARIAYNGGPARADAWIKAGRDDSVIPAESANYYRQVSSRMGTDGGGTSPIVAKGFGGSSAEGERYANKADRATGGMLKRVFGIDFNPLNLTEPERRALMVAGLSMMSSGDVGRGGLMGMQYLAGAEAGEAERAGERSKLAYQMKKDADELALRTRAEDRQERGTALEADKFAYTVGNDAEKLAWERQKQALDAGKPTDDMREYQAYVSGEQAAGRTPMPFLEYQQAVKRASAASTNVSVSGDKKGAEEMAKGFAKRYEAIQTNAEGAQGMLDNLDAVERSLGEGVYTGAGGDWVHSARRFGTAFGIADADKAAAGDLVQAIANKMALQVRSPGGESGGMPGAMSDADREFLKQTVPGLLKTPGGNAQLIAIMRAAAQRHQAIADMAIDYAQEHDGQLTVGFDKLVRDYVKANPLSKAVRPEPPSVGTIRKGHRFLGGNPADELSWERVAP